MVCSIQPKAIHGRAESGDSFDTVRVNPGEYAVDRGREAGVSPLCAQTRRVVESPNLTNQKARSTTVCRGGEQKKKETK